MLRKASFRNFKALTAVDVEFSPLTVVVGKNSAGKTSLLQGIHYVSQVGSRKLQDEKYPNLGLDRLFRGPRDPRHLVTLPWRESMQISLTDSEEHTLSLQAHIPQQDEEDASCRFTLSASGNEPPSVSLPDMDRRSAIAFMRSAGVRRFASTVYLHLDASKMVRPSLAHSEEPRLEHDGAGLASVLSYLAGVSASTLDAVTQDLAKVVSHAKGIRTFPAKVMRTSHERIVIGDQAVNRSLKEERWGHRFSLDMGGGRLVPADLLSEGTVLALGLLVALRLPSCPRLVLLDDIDRALHTSAQVELVQCLRSVLASRSDVQVVCTSHSPYFLDHVNVEEVRVMALDEHGQARCRPLSEHPEANRWRNMLRTGEFWSSVGEDWLFEQAGDGR